MTLTRSITTFLFIVFVIGCNTGSQATSTATPIVSAVVPEDFSAGDTIQIQGHGFDPIPQNNFVLIGDQITPASDFSIDAEGQEILEATVPDETDTGDTFLLVMKNGTSRASPDIWSNHIAITIVEP